MGYQFEDTASSDLPVQRIAAVIKEVGEDMDFFGPLRKSGVKMNARFAAGSYGFFSPTADDDPFSSANSKPDWSVGWQWGTTITNSMNKTMKQGWAVIFHVYDTGSTRTVVAKVQGASQRKEPTRFVKLVFGQL